MTVPESLHLAADGGFPKPAFPVLIYRDALPRDPAAIARHFDARTWTNAWQNGIFAYHHFHTTAHEVLGIAAGSVAVRLGGPNGIDVHLVAGDAVVLPAGTGHCRVDSAPGLIVVGAYASGRAYDIRRGDPAELDQCALRIAALPLPLADPVAGAGGPLPAHWRC